MIAEEGFFLQVGSSNALLVAQRAASRQRVGRQNTVSFVGFQRGMKKAL